MKVMFWSVFTAGFIACSTVGIGPALKRAAGSWTSPAMIAGTLVGLAILALAIVFAIGVRPAPLSTDTAMLVALVGLVGVKVLIGLVQAGVVSLARS